MQVTIQGDEKPVLLAEQRVGRLAPQKGGDPFVLCSVTGTECRPNGEKEQQAGSKQGLSLGVPVAIRPPPSPFQWAVEENALLVGELARLLRVGYQGSGMCHRS